MCCTVKAKVNGLEMKSIKTDNICSFIVPLSTYSPKYGTPNLPKLKRAPSPFGSRLGSAHMHQLPSQVQTNFDTPTDFQVRLRHSSRLRNGQADLQTQANFRISCPLRNSNLALTSLLKPTSKPMTRHKIKPTF